MYNLHCFKIYHSVLLKVGGGQSSRHSNYIISDPSNFTRHTPLPGTYTRTTDARLFCARLRRFTYRGCVRDKGYEPLIRRGDRRSSWTATPAPGRAVSTDLRQRSCRDPGRIGATADVFVAGSAGTAIARSPENSTRAATRTSHYYILYSLIIILLEHFLSINSFSVLFLEETFYYPDVFRRHLFFGDFFSREFLYRFYLLFSSAIRKIIRVSRI